MYRFFVSIFQPQKYHIVIALGISLIPSYIIPTCSSVNNMINPTTIPLFIKEQFHRNILFLPLPQFLCWYNNYQNKVFIIIFSNHVTQLSSLITPKYEHILCMNWNIIDQLKSNVFSIWKLLGQQNIVSRFSVYNPIGSIYSLKKYHSLSANQRT